MSGGYFWIGLSSGIPESQVLRLDSGGTGSYGYLNMGTPHLRKLRSTILLRHKIAHIFHPKRAINIVLVNKHMFSGQGTQYKYLQLHGHSSSP